MKNFKDFIVMEDIIKIHYITAEWLIKKINKEIGGYFELINEFTDSMIISENEKSYHINFYIIDKQHETVSTYKKFVAKSLIKIKNVVIKSTKLHKYGVI